MGSCLRRNTVSYESRVENMATEVKVPVLGESITEATLGEWLKQPGDAVAADEPIASLETDKVALEVPAPQAGVMGEHKVAVGDTVEVGAVIATIEAGEPGQATPAKDAETPTDRKKRLPPRPPSLRTSRMRLRRASPFHRLCAGWCSNMASTPARSAAPARMAV